ncbi:MAG: DUF456 domain-containing protein [Phycisphaerae bacterium]
MDLALAITGIVVGLIILAVGFAGCILPVLPGPPIAFLALLCLQFTGVHEYSLLTLIVLGGLALLIAVLDNLVPVWGVQRIGGSKAGIAGGAVGIVVGLFVFPPFGLILGPLVGVVLGELIAGNTPKKAVTSGAGTLLGFLCGAVAKTALTSVIAAYFLWGAVHVFWTG